MCERRGCRFNYAPLRFAPGEAGRSSRSLRSRYYDDGEDDVRGDENIIVRGSRRSLRSREYSSDEDDGAYEDRGERRRRSDDRRAPPQQPQPPAAARSTRGAQSAGGAHASATTFGRDDSGDKSAKASKNNDYAEELSRLG